MGRRQLIAAPTTVAEISVAAVSRQLVAVEIQLDARPDPFGLAPAFVPLENRWDLLGSEAREPLK